MAEYGIRRVIHHLAAILWPGAALPVLLCAFGGCSTPAQQPLRDFEALTPVTIMDAPVPDPGRVNGRDAGQVDRGKYLVELLGCGSCHTDGALVGLPNDGLRLAGSHIGIAYSDPMRQKNPGIVYPSNLTPDRETGLGQWSDAEIMQMITSGIDKHGRRKLAVMPWPAYTRLSVEDAGAIIAYLRSLKPIAHRVPANVKPGEAALQPFVYFGVYRKRP
jgi:mono/diheme cytochrome c family protein